MSFMTEDHYFSANPPPKNLSHHLAEARSFIATHAAAARRVVLVTSGGTTVPLEKQTVRFIDNFSAGTRGATSAEYFLEAGYAVIFLHRQFSLLPYSRHYSHATDCFLDFLQEGPGGSVVVNDEHREVMLGVLRKYQRARERNLLLMLPFVTITDYLYELRDISRLMRPLGPRGLLYLAAAVSDFFVPPDRMAEHKIQSTDAAESVKSNKNNRSSNNKSNNNNNSSTSTKTSSSSLSPSLSPSLNPSLNPNPAKIPPLTPEEEEETFDNFDSSPTIPRSKRLVVDLDPVPKFLKNLVDGWAPEGMIVSFKLETDPEILVHKASYSLDRYQHSLVIGNLLTTRKWEVVFVAPGRPDRWIRVPMHRRKKSVSGTEHLVGSAERKAAERRAAEGWARGEDGLGVLDALEGVGEVGDKPLDPSELPEGEPQIEIESLIIPAVEEMHSEHIRTFEMRQQKS